VGTDKACVIFKNSKNTFTRFRGGFAFTPSKRSKSEERNQTHTFCEFCRTRLDPVPSLYSLYMPVPYLSPHFMSKKVHGQGSIAKLFSPNFHDSYTTFLRLSNFLRNPVLESTLYPCTKIYLNFCFMFDKI